jgi:hypothetical protein
MAASARPYLCMSDKPPVSLSASVDHSVLVAPANEWRIATGSSASPVRPWSDAATVRDTQDGLSALENAEPRVERLWNVYEDNP